MSAPFRSHPSPAHPAGDHPSSGGRSRPPVRHRRPPAERPPDLADRRAGGQATAEYALVLLGAAAVALMLAAWAAKTGAIGDLFDAVVGQNISKAR